MSNSEKEAEINDTERKGVRQEEEEVDRERKIKESEGEKLSTSCHNCKTKTTPLWRRNLAGETLCNACGLHYKTYSKMRPVAQKNLENSPIDPSKDSKGTCPGGGRCNGTGGSTSCDGCPTYNQQHYSKKSNRCFNCKTTATPLWRRDDLNNVICNACGLYYKMYKRHRPLKFKEDVIKRRKRIQIHQSEEPLPLNASLSSEVATSHKSVEQLESELVEQSYKLARKDFPNDPINSIEEFMSNSKPFPITNQFSQRDTTASNLFGDALDPTSATPNYMPSYILNHRYPTTSESRYPYEDPNLYNGNPFPTPSHATNLIQLPPISTFYSATHPTSHYNQPSTSHNNFNPDSNPNSALKPNVNETEIHIRQLQQHRQQIHNEVNNLKSLLSDSMYLLNQLEKKLPKPKDD